MLKIKIHLNYTEQFISSSGIFYLCGTVAGIVTPKGSMSTERERDTPSFCPTLQVLDMSTFGDAADVNSVIKFLPHTLVLCGCVAACCSMSTEGETLQVSVLPYRCSICPPLVTRQMSIL